MATSRRGFFRAIAAAVVGVKAAPAASTIAGRFGYAARVVPLPYKIYVVLSIEELQYHY